MATCSPRSREDLLNIARAIHSADRIQAARILSDARNTKPGPIYWVWVNGLISGIITHTKYVSANALYLATERGVVTPIAALIGKGKELAGVGDAERVLFGETAAGLWGGLHAIPSAVMVAAKAVRSGMKQPLPSEIELYNSLIEKRKAAIAAGDRPEPIPGQLEKAMTGGSDTLQSYRPDKPLFGVIPLDGVFGRILGAPGDFAGGIHTFFKVLNERAGISAQAYRKAAGEGLNPADANFWQRVSYHAANPTKETLQIAVREAYKGTFMQDLGPRGQAWARATKSSPWLKWLFPFSHIPINLMKATYEATPAAFIDSEMRATLKGERGSIEQDKAIARMVVGSSLMGYFTYLGLRGLATGDYPTDPKERDNWKLTGKEPNSILIGDYWVSFNKFGPAGDLANIGANFAAVVNKLTSDDADAVSGATWRAAKSAGMLATDEVGFESIARLFEAFQDEKKGVEWAASLASTALPFSSALSQTASVLDPDMRQVKTFLDGIKYRIPGERETLTPKRDWSGQPVTNPQYGNIIRRRQANADPVDLEMARLDIHPAPPRDMISGVKLTPKIYDEYQVRAGALARTALERFVQQPGWHSMPAAAQIDVIRTVREQANQRAAQAMMARYPQIMQQAVENAHNRITGQPAKALQQ